MDNNNITDNQLNQNLFDYISLDQFQCYLLGYIINTSYIELKNNTITQESYKYVNINKKNEYNLIIKLNNKSNYNKLIIQLVNKLLDSLFYVILDNKIIIKSDMICKNYLYLINPTLSISNCELESIYELNTFPNLYKSDSNNYLFWVFIRGYIEKSSTISFINNIPQCKIIFTNERFMNDFLFYINIPPNSVNKINSNEFSVEYLSVNCVDLLGLVYKSKNKYLYNASFYNLFQSLINWKIFISSDKFKLDICKVYKTDVNAIIPSKGHESDVGYDLTIIKKYKDLTPSTILYDTGIKLNVDYGYYIEIVPRSSLSKSGYILANSIGIIEKSYSGNLLVALTKIDKEMPDLQLPFKCCQLIFKPQISLTIQEMTNTNSLELTSRNNGGFGSTNLI